MADLHHRLLEVLGCLKLLVDCLFPREVQREGLRIVVDSLERVPISSSSASRDPHVVQLIVDFKTFEPAARHHINSMQRQDQRLIPQQDLPSR